MDDEAVRGTNSAQSDLPCPVLPCPALLSPARGRGVGHEGVHVPWEGESI